MLSPVKLATVNNHTGHRRSVSTNPFGGRVDNDVSSVFYGAHVKATGAEGIIDLEPRVSYFIRSCARRTQGGSVP